MQHQEMFEKLSEIFPINIIDTSLPYGIVVFFTTEDKDIPPMQAVEEAIFNNWTKYQLKEVLEIAKLPKEEYENLLKLSKIKRLREEANQIESTLTIK